MHSASTAHSVRVVGPKELTAAQRSGVPLVWTVSHATSDWQRELSPFFLGPVALYGGRSARSMENAWQYAKLYAQHADADGEPTAAYWRWAEDGWSRAAVRYPMGKGAKPLHLLWDGERLPYVEARKRIYWPLYRDAVARTRGFERLKALHAKGPVTLFDFDGYDFEAAGLSFADVIEGARRPMGHAFVLRAMLLYGEAISPNDVPGVLRCAPKAPLQESLF